MAGDKASGIGCKKHRRALQFFHLPKSAHGSANYKFLATLGAVQKRGVKVGAENSRSDGVNAYIVARPLDRQRLRQGRSEEHTSELQSLRHLVCRLLLEKKKKIKI